MIYNLYQSKVKQKEVVHTKGEVGGQQLQQYTSFMTPEMHVFKCLTIIE